MAAILGTTVLLTFSTLSSSASFYVACPETYPAVGIPFAMPGPVNNQNTPPASAWKYDSQNNLEVVSGTGLSFLDVNGDSLVDLVWAFFDGYPQEQFYVQCVYLNTGCSWVRARMYASYGCSHWRSACCHGAGLVHQLHRPDTSCVPASSLIVRGIEFEWKDSDTVGSLADRIANELTDFDLNGSGGRHDVSSPTGTTPASTVRVSIASSAGVIQSRGNSMRRVAASGFSVVLSTRPMQGSSDTTRAVTNTETFYFRR